MVGEKPLPVAASDALLFDESAVLWRMFLMRALRRSMHASCFLKSFLDVRL
jgi:hypothetical protein